MKDLQRIYNAQNTEELEFRAQIDEATGERIIIGYSSLYNSPSQPMKINRNGIDEKIIERIEPNAFTQSDFSDCVFNVEHDNAAAVGRTGKNLTVQPNSKGLFFKLALPADESKATTSQNDLYKNVSMGILRSCSFAATISDNELVREGDQLVHIIRSFGVVRDLTATISPAYPETWLTKRNLDAIEIKNDMPPTVSEPVEPVLEENEIEKMNMDFDIIQLS